MSQIIIVPTSITDGAGNVASGSEVDIDNGVDTPVDGALLTTKIDVFNAGTIIVGLSDLPGDFDTVNSVQFRCRALYDNPGDQSDSATYDFTLTGAALPATAIATWDQNDTNGLLSNKGAGSLETVSSTEAQINAWTVVIDQSAYSKSMGLDALFLAISEIEVLVDYNVSAGSDQTADGSPSISPITSSGGAEVIKTADGAASISPITSDGGAEVIRTADGAASISPITSDGAAEIIRTADGAASISPITSDGDASIVVDATTAGGSPSITPITSAGVVEIFRTAQGGPSISKITASGNSFIWPKVWLNTSMSLSGATEMTVSAVEADGTNITFDDAVGAPVGSVFLGVENRANGDVGWIAVTVTAGPTGPVVVFGGFGA